jgi:hypothetical protein
MKTAASILIVLIAMVLAYQVRILARLDEISRRPSVVSASPAPSAAAIASEIRKQMAREARQSAAATFQIKSAGGGQTYGGKDDLASYRLQEAKLGIVREGGPAADLALTSPGIKSQFKKLQSTEDYDGFEVSFKPETGNWLPETWTFSLAYVGAGGKRQERSFTVAYHAGKEFPDYLEVSEKNE